MTVFVHVRPSLPCFCLFYYMDWTAYCQGNIPEIPAKIELPGETVRGLFGLPQQKFHLINRMNVLLYGPCPKPDRRILGQETPALSCAPRMLYSAKMIDRPLGAQTPGGRSFYTPLALMVTELTAFLFHQYPWGKFRMAVFALHKPDQQFGC